MTPTQILQTACARYFDHADAIISHETDRRFALEQADNCKKRLDCKGAQEWMQQAHKFALASMKETSLAGIVGNHIYADDFSSVELIGRME
jgi:hypothetical protein